MRLFRSYLLASLLLCIVAGVANAQTAASPKPTSTPAAPAAPAKQQLSPDAQFAFDILVAEIQVLLYEQNPDGNKDKADADAKLIDLYAEAIKRPGVVRRLVGRSYSNYVRMKDRAAGALQVSQAADEAAVKMNMVLIAQNQRIIELLEQLVKKK